MCVHNSLQHASSLTHARAQVDASGVVDLASEDDQGASVSSKRSKGVKRGGAAEGAPQQAGTKRARTESGPASSRQPEQGNDDIIVLD